MPPGAKIGGRSGSVKLGVVAGVCTLFAILGGQYLFVSDIFNNSMNQVLTGMGDIVYQTRLERARAAADVHTDEEIKAYYQKLNGAAPTDAEFAEFKEKDLPELQGLASGKITKEKFLASLRESA